jgi:inner membrane transporter RhtA
LMSVQPIFAALVGAVLLGQLLGLLDWAGIALIVGANVAALLGARRRRVGPPLDPRR